MQQEEQMERMNQLARNVLILSRNTLLVNLRFLDRALSQFTYVPFQETTLMTDGEHMIYNPLFVLRGYRSEQEIPVRNYLHMVMHCVFRHMFVSPSLDRILWDLACDIAVENTISELGIKAVAASRAARQQSFLDRLKKQVKFLTAEKIYHYLMEQNLSPSELDRLSTLFFADDHAIWYMPPDQVQQQYKLGGSSDGEQEERQQEGQGGGQEKGREEREKEQSSGNGGNSSEEGNEKQPGSASSRQELEQIWKDISERMQTDLETFSRQQGYGAGGLTQNLMAVNREKYDYTSFLKKFAVLGEAMKINDDEFDYIFYTYGLQRYKNMPLIEPLEYKEVKRIKEFVIAIDTSGSTSGELVQAFLQKTYNILKSTESFFTKINLHIVQCDAEIQEDAKITSQEEFDNYLEHMTIHGLGGTDFRPVFSYVEQLRKKREFTNLKGLIYFTDGFGDFPSRKPDYDTAFVYIDDDYNNPDVPPWAIKLVLQKDEI